MILCIPVGVPGGDVDAEQADEFLWAFVLDHLVAPVGVANHSDAHQSLDSYKLLQLLGRFYGDTRKSST